MQEVKSLWHRAFGDTKQYMDYYFAQKAPASRLYTDYEGVELASMMFFTPYEICFRGKLMTAEYIVARDQTLKTGLSADSGRSGSIFWKNSAPALLSG